MYQTEAPTTKAEPSYGGDTAEVSNHPAYGVVILNRTSARPGVELFGSELKHPDYMSIRVNTASNNRHLNRDFTSTEQMVCEFSMSSAQWAQFVSSQGIGGGTPITFRHRHIDGKLADVPGIKTAENVRERHSREMRQSCDHYMANAKALLQDIEALVEGGKANKSQLTALKTKANDIANRMPESFGFVMKQFAEAMEDTVASGKADIEAFVMSTAVRTGIDILKERSPLMITAEQTETKE